MNSNIFFWEFGTGELEFKKGWTVSDRPAQAAFVDEDKLVTIGFFKANVYDLEKDKVIATVEADEAFGPAGGFVTGVESSHYKFAVDFRKGTVFRFSDDAKWRIAGNKAVSPNGQFFAYSKGGESVVVDLTKGKPTSEFSSGAPRFVGNQYVFTGRYLFDCRLGAPVVEFDGARDTSSFSFTSDGTALYVARGETAKDGHAAWLVVSDLLTSTMQQNISALTSGNPVRIGAGSEIALKLSGVPNPVQKKMKKRLAEKGLQVVESSDLQLVARNQVLPSESRDVGMMLRGEEKTVSISFTPTVSEISLIYKGKRPWGKSKTNRPGNYMQGEKGENPQTTATRLSRPDPKFFENARFPTRIALFPGDMPKLKFTAQGIRP